MHLVALACLRYLSLEDPVKLVADSGRHDAIDYLYDSLALPVTEATLGLKLSA